jgi:hypothetical protein
MVNRSRRRVDVDRLTVPMMAVEGERVASTAVAMVHLFVDPAADLQAPVWMASGASRLWCDSRFPATDDGPSQRLLDRKRLHVAPFVRSSRRRGSAGLSNCTFWFLLLIGLERCRSCCTRTSCTGGEPSRSLVAVCPAVVDRGWQGRGEICCRP